MVAGVSALEFDSRICQTWQEEANATLRIIEQKKAETRPLWGLRQLGGGEGKALDKAAEYRHSFVLPRDITLHWVCGTILQIFTV